MNYLFIDKTICAVIIDDLSLYSLTHHHLHHV